jgi:hypothetical protein
MQFIVEVFLVVHKCLAECILPFLVSLWMFTAYIKLYGHVALSMFLMWRRKWRCPSRVSNRPGVALLDRALHSAPLELPLLLGRPSTTARGNRALLLPLGQRGPSLPSSGTLVSLFNPSPPYKRVPSFTAVRSWSRGQSFTCTVASPATHSVELRTRIFSNTSQHRTALRCPRHP